MSELEFIPGERVTFHNDVQEDRGIVKSTGHGYVYVVFKCDGDWDNYQNYTAAAVLPNQLVKGWS